jgi:hypothetical protein
LSHFNYYRSTQQNLVKLHGFKITIVELPGLEKLTGDPSYIRQRESSSLSKGLVALQSVVNSLSGNPFPDRVISYGYVFILNPCNFTKFCNMCINLCIHHNIITVIIEDLLRVIQCTQFHIAFFITIFLKHIK